MLFNESPLSFDFINAQQDRFLPVPLWVLFLGIMVIAIIVGIIVTLREEEKAAERPDEVRPRPDDDLVPGRATGVSEAQVAEVEPEPVPPSPRPDNLKRITGIGPKIETLLKENGITTFAQLAQTEVSRLQAILLEAGLENIADPSTWPDQARQLAQ
jgi:predicted flap endonuclease-1-like 5' DNA nuclease